MKRRKTESACELEENKRTREKLRKEIFEGENRESMNEESKEREYGFEDMDKRDGRKLLLKLLEKSISFFPKSLHMRFSKYKHDSLKISCCEELMLMKCLWKSKVFLSMPCEIGFSSMMHPLDMLSNGRHSTKPIFVLTFHGIGCLSPWKYPLCSKRLRLSLTMVLIRRRVKLKKGEMIGIQDALQG
ncbi:hypothetical protein M9H77_06318 [Catharanthus roseus]|uniref:Uncharacterized protein n=1 Tax=Catharanthus roseus TaxID=4058 RepID=A0ACC0BRS9_CATRO|nr:hypothetical protein M9H77_06318 [Catharanthus roseus]